MASLRWNTLRLQFTKANCQIQLLNQFVLLISLRFKENTWHYDI